LSSATDFALNPQRTEAEIEARARLDVTTKEQNPKLLLGTCPRSSSQFIKCINFLKKSFCTFTVSPNLNGLLLGRMVASSQGKGTYNAHVQVFKPR
jgi:hypothetical protein